MKLSANSLFHITPKLDFLISILENGFYPRYCIEEIGFFTPMSNENEFLAQPMVCFCDIPLSGIKQHVDKYGYYGLGMSKEWGVSKGISPVTYVYPHSSTGDLIRLLSLKSLLLLTEERHDQFVGIVQILKNYFKAMSGHMYKDGSFGEVRYNFYDEREWRYVPFGELEKLYKVYDRVRVFIEKEIFDDTSKREEYNKMLGEGCSLKFYSKDIRYLFVKNDADRDRLIEYIEYKYLIGEDKRSIQNMISRIYVMDTMLEDI